MVKDGSGADVTDQFTVNTENGSLTISKRTVKLTSESACKAYDGIALTKPEVTVTGDGFAAGEVSDLRATGTITTEGSVPNTIAYTEGTGFKAGNYNIYKSEGTLTITANTAVIKVTAGSSSKKYDGTALTKNEYSITGLPEGFTAVVTVSGSITDAGSTENEVTSVIIRKGNEDVTSQFSGIETANGTLTVTKRTVTLKSESASKAFDGTPLTKPDVIVGGDGFVDGEVSNLKATGSITKAGSVTNKIEYTENSGFKADNYTITKDQGTLTITQKENEIVVNAKNAEKKYDGSPLTKNEADITGLPEGYTAEVIVSGTITNAGTADNVVKSVVIKDASGNDVTDQFKTITKNNGTLTVTKRSVTLTSESMSREYNGTVLTAPNVTVTGDSFVDGEVTNLKATGTITEVGSTANPIAYTKGTGFKAGNYEITKSEGTLTITANTAEITVTAGSSSKKYDGTALTAPTVTVAGDGFVAGEVTDLKATGTITKVGSTANPIAYTEEAGFKAGNYEISKSEGTLTITANTAAIEVKADSNSKTYDGKALIKNSYSITGLPAGFTAEVKVSGNITDAGTTDNKVTSVVIRKGDEVVTDQFSGIKRTDGALTVEKRKVTLTSETASKEYDGTALTKPEVTIGGDGFVPGEVSDLKATGSITDVGSTGNNITYTRELGKFKEENYDIIEKPGTLTITMNSAAVITVTAASDTKEYDGTALTASGVTVTGLPDGFTAEGKAVGSIVNVWESEEGNNPVENVIIRDKAGKDITKFFTNVTTKPGTLTITPKSITLKSGSAAKRFDGEALTNHTLVLQDGSILVPLPILAENDQRTFGIAEKDQITFEFTGTQTYVGSSDNIFTYEISEKPQTTVQPKLASALIAPLVKAAASESENHKVSDNYEVSVVYGTLKVTDDNVPSGLVVTKTHGDKTYQIGDTIEFTITVTNIYDDARTITLEEQEGVTFENGKSSVIFENVAPGETRRAKVTHVVTAADVKTGVYSNTVKAVFGNGGGSEPGGNPDEPGGNPGEPGGTPEDPGKTWETTDKEDEFAHMTISKTVTSTPKNGSRYQAGETVTYRITVTNDGTVTLKGLIITDDLTGESWKVQSLDAGRTLTYTTSYKVTEKDAEKGNVTNTAAGTADGLKTPDPGTATVETEETEPEAPERPAPTPVTTSAPTPQPPAQQRITGPVRTGAAVRRSPDAIQRQRTRLVRTGAVRTGDTGMMGVNVLIAIGAAAGIGVLIRRRKKEKKQ